MTVLTFDKNRRAQRIDGWQHLPTCWRGTQRSLLSDVISLASLHTGCRVSGFRFLASDFGFRVSGFGFRVVRFGFRVPGFVFRVSGSWIRVSGSGFHVSCFVFRGSG